MSYKHISAKERCAIMYLLQMKLSYREIGRRLGRHHTTISREVKRNARLFDWGYWDEAAQSYANARKCIPRHCKRRNNKRLYSLVLSCLQRGWSPDSISGRLRHNKRLRLSVSPETIYQWIYRDAEAGGKLYQLSHSQHKKRKKQRRGLNKALIPHRVGIEQRPESIERRFRFGHWEGDTVEGKKGTGGIATHVERKSRYLIAAKLGDQRAMTFCHATQKAFSKIPNRLCKSLTLDNGKENVLHTEISQFKNMNIYFADAYSPWQRGTNEQTNGLLRRYFPKGMDLRTVSNYELQQVVQLINQRPRKVLNYRTPEEVLFQSNSGAL